MRKFFFIAILFSLLGCNQDNRNFAAESTNNLTVHKNEQVEDEKETRALTVFPDKNLDEENLTTIEKEKTHEINLTKEQKKNNSVTKEQKPVQMNEQGKKPVRKDRIILNVPLINQNPELRYGCEVTSLAMMLQYAGVKVDKMELYRQINKDADPLEKSPNGDIKKWGNPSEGFVGDMTGKSEGYAVFDKPMVSLINKYLPGRALNLTNKPFEQLLAHVSKGYPIVVWTTGDYCLPDRWESWKHGSSTIKTPLDLHAVVLVGYDDKFVYLNDPLSVKKQVKVNKEQFIQSWKALKNRAVSYE